MDIPTVPDHAIILTNLSGAILNWNSGATAIFGFGPEEIKGRNASLLFSPEAVAKGVPDREMETALSTGRGGGEEWNLRKDGTRFRGAGVVYPLLKEDGEPVGFVRILRDAGAQPDATKTLSIPDGKMDFVLENLKDHAIFLINKDGLIRSWNKGTERVFGYKESEVLGQPFSTIFTPEDIQAGVPEKELVVARSAGKSEDERWHQRKDGSRFWASGAVMPVQGDKDQSDFIKVLRDATDRKRAEDADRMESIGRLAGGVAHDYNNMLTSIIGYCELLASSIPEDSHHQGWLEEMLASANRAANLTRDLLSFSRKQMITPVPLNLNEIILKMEGMFRMTLGGNIQLHTVLDPDLEMTYLDKGQIEQVLLNLALNAKEAMPDGGDVTIRTESSAATRKVAAKAGAAEAASAASDATALNASAANASGSDAKPTGPSDADGTIAVKPYVTVIFKDNGKGMDEETSAHAFDPFFSTKPKATGSVGLGLSTGYGIIQQSGGTISLTSVPGTGTEFEIHLPVYVENESVPPQERLITKQTAPSRGTGKTRTETILLVEDEATVRRLASEVLRKSGFRILEAKDGEEGLAIFEAQSQAIDIVVTDVVMPKMSGLAMARKILSRKPDAPIVFMSGYSEDALSALNMPDRKCVFLHKPFKVLDLLAKIDEAIAAMPAVGPNS
ncbi:MAG: sensor hybrid histidine kinase [Fibrobacteres bacterium]|nr:sensor hybrid histidine kinase [Fibrobacterota bacterium]